MTINAIKVLRHLLRLHESQYFYIIWNFRHARENQPYMHDAVLVSKYT